MLKEMLTSVDRSFHSHVGEIKSPEAALDAMKIGKMIVDSSHGGMIPNYGLPDRNLILQSEMIKKEEEIKLEEHKNDPNYVENFKSTCDWLKEGLFESGKTRGQKLRHLEKEFLTRKRLKEINIVEEGYLALPLGKILPETEGYRAVTDVMELSEERENLLWNDCCYLQTGIVDSGFLYSEIERTNRYKNLEEKAKKKITDNCANTEYMRIFIPLYNWMQKGIPENEPTRGSKLRFLQRIFPNNEEEKTKRFSFKNFFGEEQVS